MNRLIAGTGWPQISPETASKHRDQRFYILPVAGSVEFTPVGMDPGDAINAQRRAPYLNFLVFEAGMLHARTSITGEARGEPSGWIPIREANSPPKPFDFQAERILEVPRTRNGELKEEVLHDTLKSWIENLIGR